HRRGIALIVKLQIDLTDFPRVIREVLQYAERNEHVRQLSWLDDPSHVPVAVPDIDGGAYFCAALLSVVGVDYDVVRRLEGVPGHKGEAAAHFVECGQIDSGQGVEAGDRLNYGTRRLGHVRLPGKQRHELIGQRRAAERRQR